MSWDLPSLGEPEGRRPVAMAMSLRVCSALSDDLLRAGGGGASIIPEDPGFAPGLPLAPGTEK